MTLLAHLLVAKSLNTAVQQQLQLHTAPFAVVICVYVRNLHLSLQFFPLGIHVTSRYLSLVASRVSHSIQPVSRSHLAELNFF